MNGQTIATTTSQLKQTNINFSLENKSLLQTIQYFYYKKIDLLINSQEWFDYPVDEYKKKKTLHIKQRISITNILFKTNKPFKEDNIEITELFTRSDSKIKNQQIHNTNKYSE